MFIIKRLKAATMVESECVTTPTQPFRTKRVPWLPSSSHLTMGQLNEDILRHIVSYLSLETLNRVNAANYVFYDAWMKYRYESLTFAENDKEAKRLLVHLGYVTSCQSILPVTGDPNDHVSDPNVACYVKRVVIRPWLVKPPAMTHTRLRKSLWINFNEILDPDYMQKETERQLQKRLRQEIALVVCAFNAMRNIKEYDIDWDEDSVYHPELYKVFFTPILQKWTGHLVKLTIKVPPEYLKSLASIHLIKLETLEYHFCTGVMSSKDIDDIHNGFLVFVNNLKDSLECLSLVSRCTSLNLDITRIYKLLGSFPKLCFISLSIPFDGGHLSDPLVFVQFLEKHRSRLKNISLLTSRCTVHSVPSDPECINWIQKILTSVYSPFPQLRSLALAIRPLRAPLTNLSNFLGMHMSTLDSLTLADRAFDYHEFAPLMKAASGPLDLTRLRHLRVKLNSFYPNTLYYLASEMPGLTSLDIECSSIRSHRSDPTNSTDFETFSKEIIANKHLLVNWKLQRMAIGPQDWACHIERALVECIPNLMIAIS